MKKKFLKSEKAFTLVEIMISLVLLLFIFLAFEAAFATIINSRQFNQSRGSALNVAKSVMEEVRYEVIQGRYDEVGTVDGSVEGQFERVNESFTQFDNGREFEVITNIWWEDEVQEDGSIVYDAYKKIEVTVKEISYSEKHITSPVTLTTLVADERTPGLTEDNGVIVVEAKDGDDIRVSNVFFNLTGPDHKFWSGVTDSNGELIFANLPEGDYTVRIDVHDEIMINPVNLNTDFNNLEWQFNDFKEVNNLKNHSREKVEFSVDWPVFLDINLLDEHGELLDFNDFSDGLEFILDIDNGSYQVSEVIENHGKLNSLIDFGLWPRYIYNIIIRDIASDNTYDMLGSESETWDGEFDTPESPTVHSISLQVEF